MAKSKSKPAKRESAGYAARTAPPVLDSTRSDNENEPNKSRQQLQLSINTRNQERQAIVRQNAPANTTRVNTKKRTLRALKEIRLLQKSTNLLIPRAPFLRVIKELIIKTSSAQMFRVTEAAVEALRESSEIFLTSIFEDSYLLSLHAKRVTLMPRDMSLLIRIKHLDIQMDM